MPISTYGRGAMLDAIFNNTLLQKSARYIQLHTGDPTAAGTANVAGNNTRLSVSGAASSAGVFTSIADLVWTNVSTTETYSYVSLWDASTAGNCLWTGALTTAKAVNAGDTFTIPTGSLTVSLT